MMSMSRAEMSSRRMFSTIPSGVTPASNRIRVVRPAFSIVTRHEKPCSARSRSAVRPPSRKRAGTLGYVVSANGARFAGPSSRSSRSVMLSTSVVIVNESTGTSGIVSICSFPHKCREESIEPRVPVPPAAALRHPGYPPRVSGQVPERVEIRPFHALHYAPGRVELADVVSPPYDVIDGDLRRRLLDRSPYNVVHLILPEPGAEREAGDTLEAWRSEQVVVREPRPCMYWLEQDARGPDGVRRRRAGLIAALRLEPYAPGRIRRHERTLDAPKAGRLAVLRAVRANLSPIFMSYGARRRQISEILEPLVASRAPIFEATDEEGTSHRLWRVCEDAPVRTAIDVVGSRPLTIVDGHHRYETALAYRNERRLADGDPPELLAYDFAPVYLANRHDPGLVLFPTHRVVGGLCHELWDRLPALLAEHWELEAVADLAALERRIASPSRGTASVGLVRGDGTPLLHARLRPEAPTTLDVVAVGTLVLRDLLGLDAEAVAVTDRIAYRQSAEAAAALVAAPPPRTAVALLVPAP